MDHIYYLSIRLQNDASYNLKEYTQLLSEYAHTEFRTLYTLASRKSRCFFLQ